MEWIGRKVKIESLWINIFAGSVHIENFQLFENTNEDKFIRVEDFYCNIAVNKLPAQIYEIETIRFTGMAISIVQNGDNFNFDDLVMRFTDSTTTKKDTNTEPVKYFLNDFKITGATIDYHNTVPESHIEIVKLGVELPPVSYTDSVLHIKSDFSIKSGGYFETSLDFNLNDFSYLLATNMNGLNINFLFPYFKDYLHIKSVDGLISTKLNIAGNFNNSTELAFSGSLNFANFSIVDTTGEKLTSFDQFSIDIDSINTSESVYYFNSVSLVHPYVKFAMYDDGYNFDRIMTEHAIDTSSAPIEEYANVFQMMAEYIKDIYDVYLINEYRINQFDLQNGHILFTDYTLEDKFLYNMDSLNISSDNFNSQNERIVLNLDCSLNNSGKMKGMLSVNPVGYSDMEIEYSIKGLLISDINPYSKYYVATPFLDGVVTYENSTVIFNHKLKSNNRLIIEQIKVGNKIRNAKAIDLPVKLAVALLRDPKGNIDLNIPIEGDLDDPKYKIGKVIWQIFKNIIIKAATAPYKLLANAFGGKEDDYKEVIFQYLQKEVSVEQMRILNNILKVLQEKTDVGVELVQFNNKTDEMEQLGLFTAKRKFLGYAASDTLSMEQHLKIIDLSNKDSSFVLWVDSTLGLATNLTSIQDKCIQLSGKETLQSEVIQIMELRNLRLHDYFVNNGILPERLKVSNTKEENQAQINTSPKYLINFIVAENAIPENEK